MICCRKATKKWDKVVGDRLQPAIMDKVNEQLNPQQNGRALEVGLTGRTASALACNRTLHNMAILRLGQLVWSCMVLKVRQGRPWCAAGCLQLPLSPWLI